MKLLFICGVTPTKNGLACASWINGIISRLGSDFELAVLPERGLATGETRVEALGKSILRTARKALPKRLKEKISGL